MPLHWLWIRRTIARRWGIAPPDVELYPATEIDAELTLMRLEAGDRENRR